VKFAFRRLYVYIIKLFDGLAKLFPRLTDLPQLAFRILSSVYPFSTAFLAISFILGTFFPAFIACILYWKIFHKH